MNYISEEIGLDYINWGRRKIILNAPTGAGKTTFILEQLIPYIQKTKGSGVRPDKKVLILCNRKMLRQQYFYDVVMKFNSYKDMEGALHIMTYQELAAKMRRGERLETWFQDYVVICLDEVHYFFQDSDFNGEDTYPLLLAIMCAGLNKQMLFISATIDCVLPFIKKMTVMCQNHKREELVNRGIYSSSILDSECIEFLAPVDYMEQPHSHLKCICMQDRKSLCKRIAESDGKSIIFIDDKKGADEFVKDLEVYGIRSNDICRLNSDNLDTDENNPVVKSLVMANKLMSKVLLTTSVLDNGVSVKDPEVKNVVILTESKVSFLQMLGRIRCESVNGKINLLFLLRPAEYFERREVQCRRFLEIYKQIEEKGLSKCFSEILPILLSGKGDDIKTIYHKMIVAIPDHLMVDTSPVMKKLSCRKGDIFFAINPLAIQKIGDLYLMEGRLHKLARMNPINVVFEQLNWLGLGREDLQIEDSTYMEERKKYFLEKLLSVKDFTKEQYCRFKEELNTEFGKDFFRDVVERKGSFSKEKLVLVLEKYDCELKETLGTDQRIRYSIFKKHEEEKNDD